MYNKYLAVPLGICRCIHFMNMSCKAFTLPSISLNKSGEIVIQVLAKPGAKSSKITDLSAYGVEIQIAGVAKKGEANSELLAYLQSVLKVKKNEITLERGNTSRKKTVKVTSAKLTSETLKTLLEEEMKR